MKNLSESTKGNNANTVLCGVIDRILTEKKVDGCPKILPQCQLGDVCILCDTMTKDKPKNCLRHNAT
jgi:hypothetical protein